MGAGACAVYGCRCVCEGTEEGSSTYTPVLATSPLLVPHMDGIGYSGVGQFGAIFEQV